MKKKKEWVALQVSGSPEDRAGTRGATVVRDKLEYIIHFTDMDSAV